MSEVPANIDLWDFSDIVKSETVFRDWMSKVPESDPYHLELKTQLGRTFSLRGQFESAHEILNEVESHIKQSVTVEVRYLLERGRTFNSANQQEMAIPLFKLAFELASEAQLDYLAVDAAHMMAIAEPDYETQIAWNKAKSLN